MTQIGSGVSGESWKFLTHASRAAHADYKDGADRWVTNTRFGEWDFKTGIAYAAGKFKNVLRYNYAFSKPGIPEELGEQSRDRTPLLPYQEITSNIFSNTSEWFLPNSSLKLVLGYVTNNRLEFEEHHEEDHGIEEDEILHEEAEEGPALVTIIYNINSHCRTQKSSQYWEFRGCHSKIRTRVKRY